MGQHLATLVADPEIASIYLTSQFAALPPHMCSCLQLCLQRLLRHCFAAGVICRGLGRLASRARSGKLQHCLQRRLRICFAMDFMCAEDWERLASRDRSSKLPALSATAPAHLLCHELSCAGGLGRLARRDRSGCSQFAKRCLWLCQKMSRLQILAGGMGCKHLIASSDTFLRMSETWASYPTLNTGDTLADNIQSAVRQDCQTSIPSLLQPSTLVAFWHITGPRFAFASTLIS